jgi:HD-GYP domain-containing protein (c-di-GMP phosphodiesterase class II)
VGTSYGRVEIPTEAHTSTAALRLADDRMYAHKGGRLGSARQQTHDAMLVGRRLRMSDEQLDELRRGAELHDIGKAAVPDAILNKPGPLEPHEGYPNRLAGDRIPLGARVVRVCNAFDAMTSDRPYAPALSPERALRELERGAGTEFDPNVVRAFTAAWDERASAPDSVREPRSPAGVA